MSKSRSLRAVFAATVACLTLFLIITSPSRAGASVERIPSSVRITPPAPTFDNKERLAELASRRTRVAKAIGSNSMLILFSTEPRVYAADVDYQYRQENNLFYLTNLKQKGATLVLLPGNNQVSEILFMPKRNPAAETWTDHMYSPQEAIEISGISEIWDASEFEPFIRSLRNRQPYRPKPENILSSTLPATTQITNGNGFEPLLEAAAKNEAGIYTIVPRDPDSREYKQEQKFASDWVKSASGFVVKNVAPIFVQMRLIKSPMELRLMQHAIDISTEAHQRAWAAAAEAKWEYEVDAVMAYTFKLRNADSWAYPDIVGCGPNATTLHYEESQGAVKSGELLLMDVGAEYEHYTADITRTFPVNGKFSTEQAAVYQVVYDAQEAVAKASKPGSSLSEVNRAGTEVIKDGLLKLGLITDRNSNQYRVWFMHSTSHWLGMNVHDVGGAAKFEPGVVFTNEPGIYVRPDALDYLPFGWKQDDWDKFKASVRPAFEKYRGIGVRIEDDMLITPDGVRWMSEALPRKMSDIEDFITKARRQS